MYKKVYVEITNKCNLNCSFCTQKKHNKFMSNEEFIEVLNKLKGHTKYLYFHVLGEPLLHPNINEFIDIANDFKYQVNITTNGYLINRIKDNKNIRQINISLHSYDEKYKKSLDDYLDDIFKVVDNIKDNTYIQYRIWTSSKYTKDIIDKINQKYNSTIDYKNIKNNTKLETHVFISTHEEFIWPSLDNENIGTVGTCYALKDHIGILSNGDIIPCCLDGQGIIKLGNIFENSIDEVISTSRYQNMLNGFKNNYKCEELCQKCNFIKEKN